jgi:hypothetical protein
MDAVLATCPTLQTLGLYDVCLLPLQMKTLVHSLPVLTTLIMYRCFVTDEDIHVVVSECHTLTSFILGAEDRIGDASLYSIALHAPQLTTFQVYELDGISDTGMMHLLSACVQLSTFGISKCNGLTDLTFNAISRSLAPLQELKLTDCLLSNKALRSMLETCSHLRLLELRNCTGQITMSCFLGLVPRAPLQTINLFTHFVKDAFVKDVRTLFPHAEILPFDRKYIDEQDDRDIQNELDK